MTSKMSWAWAIFCLVVMIVGLWHIESSRRECEARVCPNGGVAMILKQNCICMTPALKGTTND